jgi:hypothetical protein|tara:strand:- start:371 stop:523 length:153 start_codon:yes stop_codon:yes gene_type:complete
MNSQSEDETYQGFALTLDEICVLMGEFLDSFSTNSRTILEKIQEQIAIFF